MQHYTLNLDTSNYWQEIENITRSLQTESYVILDYVKVDVPRSWRILGTLRILTVKVNATVLIVNMDDLVLHYWMRQLSPIVRKVILMPSLDEVYAYIKNSNPESLLEDHRP